MARKKLPPNFQSWIEFYDYMKQQYPDLDSMKTIRLKFMNASLDNLVSEYSIRVDAVERLCWREIESQRLNIEDTMRVFQALLMSTVDVENKERIIRFLKKIRK